MRPSNAALLALLVPLALAGCGEKDSTEDTAVTDADSDGWSAEEDCDDEDPFIHPEGTELCDGVDNDCDGLIDDEDDGVSSASTSTWYADADGDGYGSATYTETACSQPSGFVDNDEDCDDTSAEAYPGAEEVCDGADNDCDELVDDEDDLLAEDEVWFTDSDGDGYGTPTDRVRSCEQPSGMVDNADDCDDVQDWIHPGAPEVCDGVDNDCDELVDDADDDLDPEALLTFYVDADGDGYGDDGDSTASCEAPSGYAEEGGDCDDDHDAVYPDAETVCGDGLVNDCAGSEVEEEAACAWSSAQTTAEADALLEADDSGFTSRLAHGDWDGDGLDELAVGAPWSDAAAGEVYLFDGALSGTLDLEEDGTTLSGSEGLEQLGWGLASAPDLDSDGVDELLIGAPLATTSAEEGGEVYLLNGPITAGEPSGMAVTTWSSAEASAQLGSGIVVGEDSDGDGVAELLLGAVGRDVSGAGNSGSVYLVSGAATGSVDVDDAALTEIYGSGTFDIVGSGASFGGQSDLDGDGVPDLVVGAPFRDGSADGEGAVFVLYGPVSGQVTVDDADASFEGDSEGAELGTQVLTGFDLDGDGVKDFAASAPGQTADSSDQGAVYVYAGSTDGVDPSAGAAVTVLGDAGELMGGSVDLGDLDGDGALDLLAGTDSCVFYSGSTRITTSDDGTEARIWLGLSSGTWTASDADYTLSDEDNAFGIHASFAGDMSGDGLDEVAVIELHGAYDEQGVWLWRGPGF